MDKFRDDAILAYDQGTRAYVKEYGYVFQKADGTQVSVRIWGLWHALRAYQDEQRKKGVPIAPKPQDWEDWIQRGYGEFSFCMTGADRRILITVFPVPLWPPPPQGVTINAIGQFTNFRWREGYPKANDHYLVIREGNITTLCKNGEEVKPQPVAIPVINYRLKEKGGQNG